MDAASAGPARPPDLELPEFPAYEAPVEPEARAEPEPVAPKPAEAELPEPPVKTQVPETWDPEPEPRPAPLPQLNESRRHAYSVRQTKGQSVAAFFQHLLSARPAGSAGSNGPAPLAEEPSPHPAPAADSTVSFDDFFGTAASTSGSAPSAKQDADPSKDDLDQFQSWLQNLKR